MRAIDDVPAKAVFPWLKENLGPHCLAALTGTDHKALAAAAQIVRLYSYDDSPEVVLAFGLVVGRMQASTRHLAYHAIAQATDWGFRARLWAQAGLEPIHHLGRCKHEPDYGRTLVSAADLP